MCGIAGFFSSNSSLSDDVLVETVRSMAFAIRHRGPDDAGAWVDASAGLALGHARLSILDLTDAGHQPMVGEGGRYVIAFNGEIYNHLELRAELSFDSARSWRGHSDTETLLAAFERWGLERALHRCVGMFALALWDREKRHLTLARDRFGEKPLYYGWVADGKERVKGQGLTFLFGSELKALRAHPSFDNPISRSALAQFLRLTHVPAPLSIYEGIYKLPPGTSLRVDAEFVCNPPSQVLDGPISYWSLAEAVHKGACAQITDDVEAVEALQHQLHEAVRLQSVSDVPLGAFLSGGVDSSTIVALMQAQSSRPIRTFTVGFKQPDFDESPYAAAVARHLGTDHHALYVTASEALEVIPQLPQMYDEPFADSSQIPTYLVCKAARQNVTVALSGDAGDELFGGYNRYIWGPRVWEKVGWISQWQRRLMSTAVRALPVSAWDALGQAVQYVGLARAGSLNRLGDRAHKVAARVLCANNLDEVYWNLATEWPGGNAMLADGGETLGNRFLWPVPPDELEDWLAELSGPPSNLVEASARMMFRDTLTYLPDDILCKVDRAAMAVGLETRVPFLDHRVAELAWRMPMNMKIRQGKGKWPLRQVLDRYVPRELIERPKAGFSIPLGQWLRGPLRDWAEELLDEARLGREGYLRTEPIRRAWSEHLSGRRDWTTRLWAVLMFQAWLQEQ